MNERQAGILGKPGEAPVAQKARTQTVVAARGLSRWHAAGAHLLICAGIAAAVLALMLFVWYPPPLFEAMGGSGLALILIGVDVVMGPALTLVVFRSGKRGLKFDLAVIAVFQLAALAYGCHIISLARPAFVVFVKDQFQVASVVDVPPQRFEEAKYPQFRRAAWTGPVFVFGAWPTDASDQQRLLDAGLAGDDLQNFPKYYAPYEKGRAEILAKAQPISRLRVSEPETAKVIDAWLARSGVDEESLRYVRMRTRNAWLAVLVDRSSAEPVKVLLAEKL